MNVCILGAGSWGTALALLACRGGHHVRLWAHRGAQTLAEERENQRYLPGFPVPAALQPTDRFDEALTDAELILAVVPSHAMAEVVGSARTMIPHGVPLVSCAKGIEPDSGATMDEVLQRLLPAQPLAYLSGPSFAKEVAAGSPTAVVVASRDDALNGEIQHALSTPDFRIYTSDDVVGVEIAGAVKNVMAIAAGAADGLELGHNTRAAIITRGIAEMSRLAVARGASPLTMAGLAGVGDLVLTCTGGLSRNRSVGLALGAGRGLDEILADMTMVAEGVKTSRAIRDLARKAGIEMPICGAVYDMLYGNLTPQQAVAALMGRKLRSEQEH